MSSEEPRHLSIVRRARLGRNCSDLVQVSQCYPKDTQGFTAEVIQLLETHYAVLDPALRRGLVKALILLRNKGQLTPTELHPLFFRLFRCQDKDLRQMLFRHIISGLRDLKVEENDCNVTPSNLVSAVASSDSFCACRADIKSANQKQRNERLNRSLQNFLYGCLANEGEAAAKPALAVLTELWRRQIWRDARTANVIGAHSISTTYQYLHLPSICDPQQCFNDQGSKWVGEKVVPDSVNLTGSSWLQKCVM